MSSQLAQLEAAVADFRQWADASATPSAARSGEWASGYPGWANLYDAFEAYIATSSCRSWSETTTELILYAIARDSDNCHLIRTVAKMRDEFLYLAERAITSPEWDAKWQIAAELGQVGGDHSAVEPLLLTLVRDEDEYVRRRALLSLAEIGSQHVMSLLEDAWNNGSEFQRVDILYIVSKWDAPQREYYLQLAEADPNPEVVAYAAHVRDAR